ncbi:hypothetical protein Celaphus_00016822, partial [Cervus elaphus hippelaphus]
MKIREHLPSPPLPLTVIIVSGSVFPRHFANIPVQLSSNTRSSQLQLLSLTPCYRSAVSFQIHLDFPPEVEAVIQHLLDLHLQACRTYLSLGSPFNRKLALEKLEGTNTLSPMQKQSSGCAPFLEVEKLSHMSRAQPRTLEDALLIEKNLKQALYDLRGLFSACAGPRFCHFLEVYFPSEVVKVIRRMGDHLTNLRRPTGPQAGQHQTQKASSKESLVQTKQPGENPPQTDWAEDQWEITTTPKYSAGLSRGLQETAYRITLQKASEALLLKLAQDCGSPGVYGSPHLHFSPKVDGMACLGCCLLWAKEREVNPKESRVNEARTGQDA